MKSRIRACCLLALLSASAVAEQVQINPLSAVLALLQGLSTKITTDSKVEAKTYEEFVEYSKATQVELVHEIATSSAAQEKLEADIAAASSSVVVAVSKIADLAGAVSASEEELKEATAVREKESSDFSGDEKELIETVDTLARAGNILAREMAKKSASLAQIDTTNMASLINSLRVIVDAAGFSSKDQMKLVAFVQAQQNEGADDEELAAPSAASYQSRSTSIVDIIMDLKDKAESELANLRKAEVAAKHSFAMMKQSLVDQTAADAKELAGQKSIKAAAAEEKAAAEGDLAVTLKDLAQARKSLATSKADSATKAADHEGSVKSFATELEAIAEALRILKETTAGAVAQTYSFLQVQTQSKVHTHADLANAEVVALIKKLAREQHSSTLAQLASRISAVIRYGSHTGASPFEKVKALISELIAKLEKEAGEEASEKAFCDEEMKKTEVTKDELQDAISKLSVQIGTASAKSTQLKEDVKELQAELAKLASRSAEMGKIRATESADYSTAKADLTTGLAGVRQALKVLKDYYANAGTVAFFQTATHQAAPTGAGSSIIEVLLTIEADFAKTLAEKEAAEADAVAAFQKETAQMQIVQVTKEQDVKYKTGEFTGLDKAISELSSDKDSKEIERSAVLEYDQKIKERCVSKPETYGSRKARREAEIKGLKEALVILEGETALLQRSQRSKRAFRAVRRLP